MSTTQTKTAAAMVAEAKSRVENLPPAAVASEIESRARVTDFRIEPGGVNDEHDTDEDGGGDGRGGEISSREPAPGRGGKRDREPSSGHGFPNRARRRKR